MAPHRNKSRSALGALVCGQSGFFGARGRKRRSGCMKGLRAMEAEGRISLPEAQCDLRIAKPRLLEAPVPMVKHVQADVCRIGDLEIAWIRSTGDRAIWNTLMEREHPQAA